ncbi:hypothetical protein Tco_0908177 [Tanacetum coccineum]|uniref:Uncharacterized protein n=1 Tax=Tanacetum coccineum TaxID=301880 RepID=A0ABQ5CP69_9ASTR
MTRIVAWCLGFMKWVSEDPSYVTGGELEYPQELFSAVDLLFLQFLVRSPPLDSANSCVMQGASCTQRKVSMVSFGRISPNSFLSSILLVVVIIVTVVIVMVILIVVVVAIVGVVIVVAIFGVVVFYDVFLYLKHFVYDYWFLAQNHALLFDPLVCELCWWLPPESEGIILACSILIGWAYAFHQDKASLVRVPVANVTLTSLAHLLRENTDSVRSNQRMRNFSRTSVPIGIVGICHGSSLCFQSGALRGYGMIHNDEDEDSDANDRDDDEREIS